MQTKRGKILWYDIYRRAGNPYQTNSTIKYLEENGLIEENKTDGYQRQRAILGMKYYENTTI